MGRELIVEALQRHYKIDEKISGEIVQQIIADRTAGKSPVENPTMVVIGAQPGAGKTTVQIQSSMELNYNAVLINMDDLRSYHPRTGDIHHHHEKDFGEITNPSVMNWSTALAAYCRNNNYNYIVESSCRDAATIYADTKLARDSGYQTSLKVLAVDPKLSILGIQTRYELAKLFYGFGRIVPKEFHDYCVQALPRSIEKLQQSGAFDKLDIYARTAVLHGASLEPGATIVVRNPMDAVQVYRDEVNREWPDRLKEYVNEKATSVLRMMEKRQAPKAEINAFCERIGLKSSVPIRSRTMKY